MLNKLRMLWHAYRAIEADKHPEDILAFMQMQKEQTDNPAVVGFCEAAPDLLDYGIDDITLIKGETDFTEEATFFFYVGALWERYDMLTGSDLE